MITLIAAPHELDLYSSTPVINRMLDPEMGRVTKNFLCCPSSTVYSEILLSEAGNIYKNKRNRLLPDRAESLTYLHHNLPLL